MEKEIIDNFNDVSISFLDFIKTLNKNPKIELCKTISQQIIKLQPNKLIEQYIVHCLVHHEKLEERDEDYFRNLDVKISDKYSNLFDVVKIRNILESYDSKTKNLLFDYLIILSNYAKQYFKLKYE